MTYASPFHLDLNRFLSAAGDHHVDVDPVFAKDFDRLLREMREFDAEGLEADASVSDRASLIIPSLTYRTVQAGVMLFDGHDPIGGYLSCDLSLDKAYQGQGLGAEIVIERCIQEGCNPVWHLDEAAYTPAGIAAHRSAWRRARESREETAERVDRAGRASPSV